MRMDRRQAERLLRERFGLDGFRPGQREAVSALMNGRDTVAIFPTGAGKSLCYQLPALMFSGLTLVVSPLISLMRDQVASLTRRGISAAALNSLQDQEEQRAILQAAEQGGLRLLYVSPERLLTPSFRAFCRRVRIDLLVVDEAHCVTQWGGNFRPAYEQIGAFAASLPVRPVCCAMTATTDRRMLREIRERLGMKRPAVFRLPLIRPNLRFTLRTTLQPEEEIRRIISAHAGERGVIFCATRARTEKLAAMIGAYPDSQGTGRRAAFYHAGMERADRERVQTAFASGEITVLTATSAFGMGVDIPDIRYVIHDTLPQDLTDYAQQSGRAGRDGQPADCIQLFDLRNLETIRMRYQRDRRQMERKLTPSGIRRHVLQKRELRKRWAAQRRVLDLFLGGACIPAGLSRHFGVRAKPCGLCDRCRKAMKAGKPVPLANTPELPSWNEKRLRFWALDWQRHALAGAEGKTPGQVLSAEDLDRMARYGIIPEDIGASPAERAALERVILRLHGEEPKTDTSNQPAR